MISANFGGAIWYYGLVGGFLPDSNSIQWSMPLCSDRVFGNLGGITLANSFKMSTTTIGLWVASTSSDSCFTMGMKVNSSLHTPFLSYKVNIIVDPWFLLEKLEPCWGHCLPLSIWSLWMTLALILSCIWTPFWGLGSGLAASSSCLCFHSISWS